MPSWLRNVGNALYRLLRWCVWTAIASLLPFLGAVAVQSFSLPTWQGLPPIIGSGQLLPTSIALLLGGMRELSITSSNLLPRMTDFLMGASAISSIFIAIAYGWLLNEVAHGGVSKSLQLQVTNFSTFILVMSAIAAGFAALISTPVKAQT